MIDERGPVCCVGGLRFRKQISRWRYKVVSKHGHSWAKPPTANRSGGLSTICAKDGTPVARLSDDACTLLPGYAWDGSSGPAIDTKACMRASALHDVWCQAMKKKRYKNSYRNWRRGAAEYRSSCRADGMSAVRAQVRYLAMCAYGLIRP